jgi:hypothetical protein
VEQPVAQLQEQLPREAVLNVDETGWRTNGDTRWIWALVAHQFVFYVVASTRSAEVLVSLLGSVFHGILCNDRWVVYLKYHSGRMQLCWAHLKRNLLGIADYASSPSSRQFCRDTLAIVARVFRLWYRFRGDLRDRRGNPQPLDRQQLYLKSIHLQKKLLAWQLRMLTTPTAFRNYLCCLRYCLRRLLFPVARAPTLGYLLQGSRREYRTLTPLVALLTLVKFAGSALAGDDRLCNSVCGDGRR